jgi:hypothetical protein
MLIPLVVAPLHHFTCMGLILLLGRIRKQTDVVMDIEVEERTRLATRLVDNEIIERVMLSISNQKKKIQV